MIISCRTQKGGVGKTTLATHIASALARAGRAVILVDADPQGSALDWAQKRAQCGLQRLFGVVGLARETLHFEVPELAKTVDDIVIDGPPRVTARARSAMLASDAVIIPVQPSPYDVWASAEVVSLVADARIFKPNLRAAFVVNRAIVRTILAREVRSALQAQTLPLLSSVICQRVIFAESVATGRLVHEIDPESAATHEIAALAAELRQHFA